jgi:hypothetical protein
MAWRHARWTARWVDAVVASGGEALLDDLVQLALLLVVAQAAVSLLDFLGHDENLRDRMLRVTTESVADVIGLDCLDDLGLHREPPGCWLQMMSTMLVLKFPPLPASALLLTMTSSSPACT